FEGLGVDTSWELTLPRASNPFDFRTIADVLITIDYTALDSAEYRQRVIRQLGDGYRAERPFSLREEFADAWYDLHHPPTAAKSLVASFSVAADDFAPNVSGVVIDQLTLYFARAPGASFEVPIERLELAEEPDAGPICSPGGASSSLAPATPPVV